MKPKPKRIIIALLSVVLALALGAGLLFVFLPNGIWNSGKIAELSEGDFEFNYVSSLSYSADTEETSGAKDVYGWGYKPSSDAREYAYITKINNTKLADLKKAGIKKLVINIPETHNSVPVRYVAQDAFNDCELTIVDIRMPLSVHWQIKDTFTFDNNFEFARADGMTATFKGFSPKTGSGITTLILPSNVWIDRDKDGVIDDNEPTYRYTEYLFKSNKDAVYKNLVVMPDVVNIFNGEHGSTADRPKMQGGLLSKSQNLESVYFCTGRSEVLHLYPLTFENCTSLKEISLSAGVYLEDGARVFQGSSALEKFYVADEKTASAPLFYTVGADGALYTNNYSYSYYTQSSTERYYEWWKKGQDSLLNNGNFDSEWVPTKVWDSETKVGDLGLEEPAEPKQQGIFKGAAVSGPTTSTVYKAKSNGSYGGGVGIPKGSYVFDVNGTPKSGSEDPDNDFAKGTDDGQYAEEADFQSTTLTTNASGKEGSIKATLSAGSSNVTVTEVSGGNQSASTITVNGVEYKSHMQFKKGSERYLKIEVPFGFSLCAYFAGGYAATKVSATNPQLALFDSSAFKADTKGKTYTAKTSGALATLSDVTELSISGSATHLLKIESDTLSSGTYYIAQPSDDNPTSGHAQMFFLVITPSQTQVASSIVVEQDIDADTSTSDDWERIPNDALIFQRIKDNESYFFDLRYPTILRYDKSLELPLRVKALSSAGETLLTQDISWAIMDINGQDVSKNLSLISPANEADENGYFKFWLKLDNIFTDSDFYGDGQHKQGKNFAVRFTAGDVTKYIFINLLPEAGNKNIPDADQGHEPNPDPKPQYLNLVEENSSRYQTLVSMPAKAQNDAGEYVNSFDFDYHETVEIGPNAFQNTYITVIDIPDRIAKIGASAFRFSDHLQTVYLPDAADVGLNAFGQEPDASPQDGTVYTAGKNNFFLIAPSRTSFEHYLMYAAIYSDSGQKELEQPNYNVFPAHVESEVLGFDEVGGKDASYDYTPYLTYEIAVNFLTYGGNEVQGTQTRTFLYGMDARYVKATATTEWANFDDNYNNNAPVWFGRINQDNQTVQQINTISTQITWSIAADGWYYNEDATIPAGDWYFGQERYITGSESAEERVNAFTKFIGGWSGGHVNGKDIRNLAQAHYAEVYYATSGMNGVTQTGEEPTDLRLPVDTDNYSYEDDCYFTTEFEKQTRWNRWYWDEKFDLEGDGREDGAVVQRFFTMPFSITLRNVPQSRESRIDFDVPTFQNIGEITYGEDTINAAPEAARDDTWNVPMLTVTFDYNGFPASRIFENFNSDAMKVEYKAWRRHYADKEWRWDTDSGPANWTTGNWDAMREAINGDWVPYDAGYYLITLSFDGEGSGDYLYYWSGVYNGMRVDEDAEYKTTFTFILNIQPRKVPLSNVYSMQYSGQGFSLFEDNPYVDVVSYGGNYDYSYFTAEGLPYAVGRYLIKLKLHDPKYPNPNNEGSWTEDINRYTPNLEWEGAAGYDTNWAYTQGYENNELVNRFIYTDGVELFILDGDTPVDWGMLYEGEYEDRDNHYKFTAPLAMFNSEVQTYTYTGAPIPIEDVFGGVFSSSSINYTIERNGKSVTEINNAGTYIISITPAEGYIWWKGIPTVDNKTNFHIDSWSLDEFWEEQGGYVGNERKTLIFEVNINKRPVNVPRDSYVPTGVEPPYVFEVPIGGDYEVMGYHMHNFEDNIIPSAGSREWVANIFETGVYDVLLRLTDPANTTWAPEAGESRGDNFYVVARLYAGFDREKAYPDFQIEGTTAGSHASDPWVTFTRTYDGKSYNLDALFGPVAEGSRPSDREAKYTIYKLSRIPNSVSEFSLNDEVEAICEAGYYGIVVALNDPFLYKGTNATVAYYLVEIKNAEITPNELSSFEWERSKIFSVDDGGIELKLPADPADPDYPLNIVSPTENEVTVTYHLETHEENNHDTAAIEQNIEKLNSGEDVFGGDWYTYSDRLKVKEPGGYCVYVKVEAPNHNTYYGYISLHIYHEELTIKLKSDVGNSTDYGNGKHTQEELRKAVFENIESITVAGGGLGGTEDKKDSLKQDYFFFYFTKDGEEYDIDETIETYLDVGKYELCVRYNGPVIGTAEDTARYIIFKWADGTPTFTITPRELKLDLGEITGHTYYETPTEDWHSKEEFTYNGKTDDAIVSRNGVQDDLQMSYQFKLGEDTFRSFNILSDAGSYTVEALCGNTNYNVTLSGTYTYEIAARVIAVLNPESVAYDKAEHKPNLSFTGLPENLVLLEGDDKSYTLSYSPLGDAKLGENKLPLTAGSYTVTVTLVSKNYTFASGATATLTFVIDKTTLSAPYLSVASFTYTGEDLKAEVLAVLGNYDPEDMTAGFYTKNDGSGEELLEVKESGDYFLKVTLTNGSYEWAEGTEIYLPFTVAKRSHTSVTITATDVEVTYGDEMKHPTVKGVEDYEVSYVYMYEGTQGTEYESSSEAPTNVGKYIVTITAVYAGGTNDEPFTATTTATLTIKARTIGVTLNPANVAYDKAEHKPNLSFTGLPENLVLLEGDDKSYTLGYSPLGDAKLGENKLPLTAGSYTVTVTLVSKNYTFASGATATLTFVIDKTTLSAPYISAASFTYTGEDLKAEVLAVLGNYNEDDMTSGFYTKNDGSGEELLEIKESGDYFLKVTLTNSSYEWTEGTEIYLSFTVAKRQHTSVTITATDVEVTYGDEMVNPTVSGVEDYEVTYRYTYLGTDGTSYELSSEAPTNVGKYIVTITAVYAGGTNDEPFTATTTATLTIKARTIGVTLNPANVPYDKAEHKPNLSFTGLPENLVLLEGDDKSYTLSYSPIEGAQLGKTGLPLTAGSYTVTVTLVSKNYTFEDGTTATLTFVIDKTTLSAPYLSVASFTYTGEDLKSEVLAVLGNYDPEDMTAGFYTKNDGSGEELLEVKESGDYFLKVTLTNSSYEWTEGTEIYLSFTVAKRQHTSVTITATDVEVTYGDEMVNPTVSGIPEGYEVTYRYTYLGTDGTSYELSSEAPTNVGKYIVTITAVYAGGTNDEPFTATTTATLTIKARKLTFSLDSTEGADGIFNAVFKDENGNSVSFAATEYTFAYSFNGTAVESMTVAGDYTITVTLSGDAAKNNTLINTTAVYKFEPVDTAAEEDLDIGVAVVLMVVQIVLLGVVFGLATKRKREQNSIAEEDN